MGKFISLYKQFLSPGDLCFDIGSNFGNRTRCFAQMGCKVVAVEPRLSCYNMMSKTFHGNGNVRLVKAAVGRQSGKARLHTSPDHVLSTLSESFMDVTKRSGRFSEAMWNHIENVEMITLDQLIQDYGIPDFIKIDVEGYESEVMAGLSHPVTALSLEWVPELPDNALKSLEKLVELGNYEFNLSWGESMRFSRPNWRSLKSILAVIGEFEGDSEHFGDIYARLRK